MVDITKCKQQELFPWDFFIGGLLICLLLTCARLAVNEVENPVLAFFVTMLVSALIGYIPIKIAYEKQTKHRRGIYILSVITMSIASPFISIVAIIWACCDKKIDHTQAKDNTRNQNTSQPDKRKNTEETTATYGWQDWE